jgi:hypothetical protein
MLTFDAPLQMVQNRMNGQAKTHNMKINQNMPIGSQVKRCHSINIPFI